MGAKLSSPVHKLPEGRTFVVTGGNTGIGYETSKAIARMGGRVIIACRSEERATQAIERMKQEHRECLHKAEDSDEAQQPAELELDFIQLDLSSLQSTMDFIEAYKQRGYPLHVLICNAGIAMVEQGYTVDGFERQFQINYLSHFLLILHLLPVMRSSLPDARIVLVSSTGHKFATWDKENVQGKIPGSYGRLGFYGKSKLYQIMLMYALQRRMKGWGITVNSLHPGQVKTEIDRNFQDHFLLSSYIKVAHALGFLRNPLEGAATTITCAVDPELADAGGIYFSDCKPDTSSAVARDFQAQEELWTYSLECLKNYLSDEIRQQFPACDENLNRA